MTADEELGDLVGEAEDLLELLLDPLNSLVVSVLIMNHVYKGSSLEFEGVVLFLDDGQELFKGQVIPYFSGVHCVNNILVSGVLLIWEGSK